jgi:hypothetical protein
MVATSRKVGPMLGAISALFVIVGGVVARLAERFPAHTEKVETIAGYMLIGGLFAIGSTLPVSL